jgi:hypothetical protein
LAGPPTCALLGEDQSGAIALGLELRCGEGDRDADPVQEHFVRVDDALGRDDVLVDRLIGVGVAVWRGASAAFPPADAEVELQIRVGVDEPARLRLLIGPGRERSLGRCLVPALDDEGGVLHRSLTHRMPPSVRRYLRRGTRQGGRSGAPSWTAVRRSIAPRAAAPPARSGRCAHGRSSPSGRARWSPAPEGVVPPPAATSAAGVRVR